MTEQEKELIKLKVLKSVKHIEQAPTPLEIGLTKEVYGKILEEMQSNYLISDEMKSGKVVQRSGLSQSVDYVHSRHIGITELGKDYLEKNTK